ncbi:Mitochondrial import inner membrane translocase subunit Tim10/Tim12, partial [Cynara cardunculus var. scolymus]
VVRIERRLRPKWVFLPSLNPRLPQLADLCVSPLAKVSVGSFISVMAANNDMPTALDKEQIFGMAEKEMEYRVELFNKLTQTCFAKCVEKRYKESELNMGENSCIDRCVSKYWQVTNLIGQLLGSGRPPM